MKHIKKMFLVGMLLPVSFAFADTQPQPPVNDGLNKPPHEARVGGKFGHDRMMDKLSKELDLTDSQVESIKSFHEQSRMEMDQKIKSVLTPEQAKKFEEMKAKGPKGERSPRPEQLQEKK